MAEKTTVKEVKSKVGECPWCNFENKDEKVAEVHEAVSGSVLLPTVHGGYQCTTCGKNWTKGDVGKPWSLALERGAQWEREMRARELRG